MKTLTLTFEQLTDLWWSLSQITRTLSVKEYPELLGILKKVDDAYQGYRIPLPRDPLLESFIAGCMEIQKETDQDVRRSRVASIKAANPGQVNQLKDYYRDLKGRQAQTATIQFEPLLLNQLPKEVSEDHLTVIKPLLT